jgi:hypothetical protein
MVISSDGSAAADTVPLMSTGSSPISSDAAYARGARADRDHLRSLTWDQGKE